VNLLIGHWSVQFSYVAVHICCKHLCFGQTIKNDKNVAGIEKR